MTHTQPINLHNSLNNSLPLKSTNVKVAQITICFSLRFSRTPPPWRSINYTRGTHPSSRHSSGGRQRRNRRAGVSPPQPERTYAFVTRPRAIRSLAARARGAAPPRVPRPRGFNESAWTSSADSKIAANFAPFGVKTLAPGRPFSGLLFAASGFVIPCERGSTCRTAEHLFATGCKSSSQLSP